MCADTNLAHICANLTSSLVKLDAKVYAISESLNGALEPVASTDVQAMDIRLVQH